MAGIAFLPYTASHRAGCLALFEQNCPDYFAPNERDDYAAFLDTRPPGYRVGVQDGEVVAAFGLIDAGLPGRRRINWILVAPHTQGRGIGAAMMHDAVRQARAAGALIIDIAASHKSAAFFEKFGARAVRFAGDGWGPGMHRVDMELRVPALPGS